VTVDEVVRVEKGRERPIQPLDERCLQVALHAGIDLVVPNESNDLRELIATVEPHVFVKG
jgi:bifunctional ADP-heptose synthase (sugar kinase/adenylyltransferase)